MLYYKLVGKQAVRTSVEEWAVLFESTDRVVKQDVIKGVRVSTIFLGLDHSFSPAGPLHIFETMVFGGEFDRECWRYSTWEEAETGHEEVRRLVLSKPTAAQSLPAGTVRVIRLGGKEE